MKTKSKTTKKTNNILHRPLHLHTEYFFRKRYVVMAVMALVGAAIIKSDGSFLHVMRDAYNHNYALAGRHLREEPVHMHSSVAVARIPTVGSR